MNGPSRNWWKVVALLAAGAVAGLAIGGYAGFRYGIDFFSRLQSQTNLYRATSEVSSSIRSLEALEKNELSLVREALELRLDSALVEFSVNSTVVMLCDPKATEAISRARSYRSNHPGPFSGSSVGTSVTTALALCQ